MTRSYRPLIVLALVLACSPAGQSDTGEGPGSSAGPTSTSEGSSAGSTAGAGDSSGTPTSTTTTSSTTTGVTGEGPTGTASSSGAASDTATMPDLPGETGWRSVLYPEDWTPAFSDPQGRFLHDFSYAGYHNGEAEFGQDLPAKQIDVVADHKADPTGQADATAAFQAALDAAALAGGAIVNVPAGLYRIDGQLTIAASRVVLRGVGAEQSKLWFTRFMNMGFQSHLNVAGALKLGDEALLTADGVAREFTVTVADAGAYKVGDDVAIGWVITPEFIAEHGMTGTWMVFNDKWQAFFWRTVVAVDGDTLTLDVPLRYPAKKRDKASVQRVTGYLQEVGVEDLGLANAVGWDDAWAQSQVHALSLRGVKDAWVRGVASFVSPGAPAEGLGSGRHLQSSGIEVLQGKRVTIADSTLGFSEHRGDGGNGYLFEISQSSEILTRDCVGRAGRHNFIQNWGFGATGIVWLRVHSLEGKAVAIKDVEFGLVGLSEFHHSLATANLIDHSTFDDGWGAVNRGAESSGAGHSSTQSAVWNPDGSGVIRSRQFGLGYVIGPAPTLGIETSVDIPAGAGTEPVDLVEKAPADAKGGLIPVSLYEDQLMRRLGG
jgi:hypothetical protein